MPEDPAKANFRKVRPAKSRPPGQAGELEAFRERTAQTLERMLRRIEDPLLQQYTRLFFDPEIHPRLMREAQQMANKMRKRLTRGSDEYQHQAGDLVNHAMERICQLRRHYSSKKEFTKDFVQKFDNYDRAARRAQPSRAFRSEPLGGDREETPAVGANVVHILRPDEAAELQSDLDTLWRAVCDDAPELLPLLEAMSRNILKPNELARHLNITDAACRNLRARLARLAHRILGDPK